LITEIDFKEIISSKGDSLYDISMNSPVLINFLRHFGCTFCREAMSDIYKIKDSLIEKNITPVFVHMSDNKTAEHWLEKYNWVDVHHISDPTCDLYAKFGLVKATVKQLTGLGTWIRGFEAGVINGHGMNTFIGDGFQMPGVFIIEKAQVTHSYIHKVSSDRPDYLKLISSI